MLCTLLGSFEAYSMLAAPPATGYAHLTGRATREADIKMYYGQGVRVSQWEQRYGRKAPKPYGVGEEVAPPMGTSAGGRWYGSSPSQNYGVGEAVRHPPAIPAGGRWYGSQPLKNYGVGEN